MMASMNSLSNELATCLAANAGQMWQCYLSSSIAEPMFAAAHTNNSSNESSNHSRTERPHEASNHHQEVDKPNLFVSNSVSTCTNKPDPALVDSTTGLQAYIAGSLSKELNEQIRLVQACEAERKHVEMTNSVKLLSSNKVQEELGPGPVVEIEEVVKLIDADVDDNIGMGDYELNSQLLLDTNITDSVKGTQSHSDQVYLAKSLVNELEVKKSLEKACIAEGKFVETITCVPVVPEEDESDTGWVIVDAVTMINKSCNDNEIYLAESLVSELAVVTNLKRACMAEARYVEITTPTPSTDDPNVSIGVGTQDETKVSFKNNEKQEVHVVLDTELEAATEDIAIETNGLDEDATIIVAMETDALDRDSTNDGVAETDPLDEAGVTLQEKEEDSTDMEQHKLSQSALDITSFIPLTETVDVGVNVVVCTTHASTSTDTVELIHEGINTDSPLLKEVGSNTTLSCFDLMQRVKEMEELQFLKAEHQVAMTQLNKERSQRMVAEQLADIIQSDLSNLRERNVSETAMRLQLENELSDVKGELSFAERQLEEKEQRITELEESLSGTSLLVRKLEEQNAVSLMNRGGIDYMLQAKLAEGRAQEAEQKLQVTQTELLQSQGEVRRLLDRLSESSRDRSEMVSSRVHLQLMQIADEKAMMAERKVQELEKEVRDLRSQLALQDSTRREYPYSSSSTGYSGLTGLTSLSLGSSSGLFSTSNLGSTYSPYTNPYSLGSQPTQLPSLSDQYNLKSSMAASSSPLSETTLTNGSTPFSYTGSTSGTAGLLTNRTELKQSQNADEVNGSTLKDASEKDVVTEESSEALQLPSFDLSTGGGGDSTVTDTTATPLVSTTDHGDGNDSDSSDWSSSSDEDGRGETGEGGDSGSLVRPSHHTSLISEWEWRTTHDDVDNTKDSSTPQLHTTRKTPPPVAPKPHSLRKLPSTEGVTLENPSSFDEPAHGAALQLLSKGFRRVKGPRGRNLPSRYRGVQIALFS